MSKELVVKKCFKCGAMVKVLKDCHCGECGFECCGEQMKTLVPNSVDAAVEKHVPTYEVKDGKIFVKVNHVMEEEHYIEFIAYASEKGIQKVFLKPNTAAKAEFVYDGKGELYSYCNKHLLWKTEVK